MTDVHFVRKRGSLLIAFDKFSIMPLIGAVFFLLLPASRGTFDGSDLVILVVLCFGMIAKAYSCLTTFYTTGDEHLLAESGLLQKKRVEISYRTITTIDLSQNLAFQLFHVSLVKVDNGAAGTASEVKLVLPTAQAEALRDLLRAKKQQQLGEDAGEGTALPIPAVEEERQLLAAASLSDLLHLGVLRSKVVYYVTVISALFVLMNLASQILFTADEMYLFEQLVDTARQVWMWILLIVGVYLLVLGLSVARTLITYYDFRLYRGEDNIYIQYGLLSRKRFTVPVAKISGVRLEQSLFMRPGNFYTAKLCVMGKNDVEESEKESSSLLFPIGRLPGLSAIIGGLVPEFDFGGERCPAARGALRYFFIRFGNFFWLLLLIGAIVWGQPLAIAAAAVFLLLTLIGCYLLYRNTAYCLLPGSVVVFGGGFVRSATAVRRVKIENVRQRGSRFKLRRGYGSVTLGILAPAATANVRAENLRNEDFRAIEAHLQF